MQRQRALEHRGSELVLQSNTPTAGLREGTVDVAVLRWSLDDDRFAAVPVDAAGQAMGLTSEATARQHARPGAPCRPVQDAPPVEVHLAWWRDSPRPLCRSCSSLAGPAEDCRARSNDCTARPRVRDGTCHSKQCRQGSGVRWPVRLC